MTEQDTPQGSSSPEDESDIFDWGRGELARLAEEQGITVDQLIRQARVRTSFHLPPETVISLQGQLVDEIPEQFYADTSTAFIYRLGRPDSDDQEDIYEGHRRPYSFLIRTGQDGIEKVFIALKAHIAKVRDLEEARPQLASDRGDTVARPEDLEEEQ